MSFPGLGQTLYVKAPAKINLFLYVKRRRPDGYHDLITRMQKLELADHIHLTCGNNGIVLSCPGANLPEGEDNLAFRAARAFCEYTGISRGVTIELLKRIPVAAGLGGGSSDAAAVLKGMNSLFDACLELGNLLEIASMLGADVPFFIVDFSAADAEGIGDRLKEADGLTDCWLLLVNPGFPVSTKWVFEHYALTIAGNPYMLASGLESGDLESDKKFDFNVLDHDPTLFHNDLELVTVSKYPVVGRIKDQMLKDGARGASMTGSGPTVYGLFEERGAAEESYNKFCMSYSNVFLTTPYNSRI